MTNLIPFTQYLLPDGRPVQIQYECDDDEVFRKATELLQNGYCFEAEILTTGIVSFTCERGDDLIGIELSQNGPEVVEKVNKLINEAHGKEFFSGKETV